jgi:subfamily B ATP-binding cassette protein MsbA
MMRDKFSEYRSALALAWRYGAAHKGMLTLFVLLAIFGSITESVGVFLLVPLLETMGKNNIFASVPLLGGVSAMFDAIPQSTRLLWAGGLMLIVVLLRGGMQFAQEFLGYVIPYRIDLHWRLHAFDALLRAPMQFTDGLKAGQISDITSGHPPRMGIAWRFIAMLVANLFALAFYILVLTIVSPLLLVLAAVYVIAATLLFRRLTTKTVHRVGDQLAEANQSFGQLFFETLNAGKMIRLSGATDETHRQVESALRTLQSARYRTVAVENMAVPFFSTLGGTLICIIVLMIGMVDAAKASAAIGLLVVFFVLILRILSPLSIISICRNNIIIHLHAFREYDEFITAAERGRARGGTIPAAPMRKRIRLQNVSFAYNSEASAVVKDINVAIDKGRLVAVVGPSGSGKSTIVNLVTGLYRPTAGRVLVDGVDLHDIAVESWWKKLGVATQEPLILNNTIYANITLGAGQDLPPERVREAAKFAALDEVVERLPDGYNTLLGDRGSRLSGGEKQRVSLARAYLRSPDILILDEATSALDPLTESTILKNISSLVPSRTVLMISHRLQTIRQADLIIVMEGGRIVEAGRHGELMEVDGLYRRMLESQTSVEGTQEATVTA